MKVEQIPNRFVVIGASVNDYAERTRLASVEGGIEHAKKLIRDRGNKPGTELYVVKIVAVVRSLKPEPPIEVVLAVSDEAE